MGTSEIFRHGRSAVLILLAVQLPALFEANAATSSLAVVATNCRNFQANLEKRAEIRTAMIMVPKSWQSSKGEKIPLFYWRRPALDSSYPPLLFIHGGVVGSSATLFRNLPRLVDEYPGDVIGVDLRGEGCSNTLAANLHPREYGHLRINQVVRDLEFLRTHVFNYRQWRVFGQSRGAAIVHHYLEKYPRAIESAHAHGFTVLTDVDTYKNSLYRARGYAARAQEYLKEFPGDDVLVDKLRNRIPSFMCWNEVDDIKVCGPSAMDVYGIWLTYRDAWTDLHNEIGGYFLTDGSIDQEKLFSNLAIRIRGTVYSHFNYIVGTNGQDFGSPNSRWSRWISDFEPETFNPFVSEIRYYTLAVNAGKPDTLWNGNVDIINYASLALHINKNRPFFLYASRYDAIASPEAFGSELRWLSSRPGFHFEILPNSGHEGWGTERVVFDRLMLKSY